MSRTRSFAACGAPGHQGASDTWFTPLWLVSELGAFDLDPCTQSFRPFDTAKVHYCEDEGADGLALPWSARVWLNPPYGRATPRWLERMAFHADGIALVFARTETAWCQAALRSADAVNLLAGRVSFIRANGGPSTNAACGSLLLAWGQANVRAIRRLPGFIVERGSP